MVAQQAPLLRVMPLPRVLQVLVSLLKPQLVAQNPAPQAQPDWQVWAFLATWHRALARP